MRNICYVYRRFVDEHDGKKAEILPSVVISKEQKCAYLQSVDTTVTRRIETRSLNPKLIPDTRLVWPIKIGAFWLSSYFGPRLRGDGSPGFHFGIDLAAPKGTLVTAPLAGKVLYAGYTKGYGNMVVIKHGARFKTRYAHLDVVRVKVGEHLAKGSLVGKVGDTGCIRKEGKDGSHLHFELYEYDKRVNPVKFLPKLVC